MKYILRLLVLVWMFLAVTAFAGPKPEQYAERVDTVRWEKQCHYEPTECPDYHGGPFRCAVLHQKEVCKWIPVTDTVFADKVQVWLTPEELKALMNLLHPTVRWDHNASDVIWLDAVGRGIDSTVIKDAILKLN